MSGQGQLIQGFVSLAGEMAKQKAVCSCSTWTVPRSSLFGVLVFLVKIFCIEPQAELITLEGSGRRWDSEGSK